jgi:3-deoxy-D-manno-octulosonate 8-phosphate phosphatase (KDO 8-P phosphatase)
MMNLPDNLKEKISKITHLILDVDGVLTDGRIIFDDEGRELKFYDVKDGHGIKLLMRAGIEVILLTGRSSNVVDRRAKDLQITDVYKGAKNKIDVYESILAAKGLRDEQVACMGDDIVDIKILRRSGFAVAPSDASEHVKNIVDFVTVKCAGRGAVRELCELILQAQGTWDEVVERYSMDAHG